VPGFWFSNCIAFTPGTPPRSRPTLRSKLNKNPLTYLKFRPPEAVFFLDKPNLNF